MFEYLGTVLVTVDPGFDVLRYLTVRTIGGTITALLISILMGPLIINLLKSNGQKLNQLFHPKIRKIFHSKSLKKNLLNNDLVAGSGIEPLTSGL